MRVAARVAAALLLLVAPASAADYAGPLIDAHSHLPNATAIDAYIAAADRHRIERVLLLGVGGVQKDDAAWIGGAARKYPDRVLVGLPVPDPTSDEGVRRLEPALTGADARALGEIHIRQVSRKIDRDPTDPAFGKLLDAAARHRLPVVVHLELDDRSAARLEKALASHRTATVVVAHAGGATPARLDALLDAHPNLVIDLSGMHFQRTPALATETGPIDAAFKTLLEKRSDRFLMGIDLWAPRLFEPATLDRLMRWTRRVLGELSPAAAERIAYGNAAKLYRVTPKERR